MRKNVRKKGFNRVIRSKSKKRCTGTGRNRKKREGFSGGTPGFWGGKNCKNWTTLCRNGPRESPQLTEERGEIQKRD